MKGVNSSICTHDIYIKEGCKSVCQSHRRINPTLKDIVKEELQKLLDARFIYPISDNQLVSLLVLVQKKNKKWRIYVDYRELKKTLKNTISLYISLTKSWMALQERTYSFYWMDSMVIIRSRSTQRTKLKPHSLVLGVPFLIGSFLFDYVMPLPLFKGQF